VLVVGVSLSEIADKTGNAGANPGRPRRCKQAIRTPIQEPLPDGRFARNDRVAARRRVFLRLASQKTYQHVTDESIREGRSFRTIDSTDLGRS
jgi:hypothetical protein